jgi:hypothetical protein
MVHTLLYRRDNTMPLPIPDPKSFAASLTHAAPSPVETVKPDAAASKRPAF